MIDYFMHHISQYKLLIPAQVVFVALVIVKEKSLGGRVFTFHNQHMNVEISISSSQYSTNTSSTININSTHY